MSQDQPTEVFALLPIDKIDAREQVRGECSNLDELAQSLKAAGQQVPITVYADPMQEGMFVILHGERRWRAAQMAGLSGMKALIVPMPASESNRISDQLIENLQRDAMKPMEISAALAALSDAGLHGAEIAEQTGLNRTLVSRYLSLQELPAELARLVNDGSLEDVIAIDHIKRAYKVDKDRTLSAIEDLKNEAIEQAQRDGTPNTKPEPFRLSRRMAKKIATDVSICQSVTKAIDPDARPEPDTSMHLSPRGGGSGGSSGGNSGGSSSSASRKSSKTPKKSGKEQIEDANPFMAPPPAFETEPDENGAVAVGNSSWKKPASKTAGETDEPPFDETEVKEEDSAPASRGINVEELPEGCHLTQGTRSARIRVNVWTTSEINGDMMQQEGWLETNIVCDDPKFCCVKLDSGTYLDFAVECISIAAVQE